MNRSTQKHQHTLLIITSGEILKDIRYGADTATLELAQQLAGNPGFRVFLACLHSHGGTIPDHHLKSNIHWILESSWDQLIQSVKSTLTEADCIVEISGIRAFFDLPSRAFIAYHHNPSPILTKDLPANKLINIFRIPVVCVSAHSTSIQHGYGVPKSLLRVIPNGLGPTFQSKPVAHRRIPHSLIYAGMIAFYKGVDKAIAAFRTIRSHYPEAQLTICGINESWPPDDSYLVPKEWFDSDGRLNWRLIQATVPGITYLGEQSSEQLATLFQAHSILIAPSRYEETFGLVSIEAQSQGCIPVLPRKGGFPETIQEGTTGYCYEESTLLSLANQILELWDKGFPSAEQSERSQAWAQQQFKWSQVGDRFTQLITHQIDQSSPLIRHWRLRKLILALMGIRRDLSLFLSRNKIGAQRQRTFG